jgi:hypothetical protein
MQRAIILRLLEEAQRAVATGTVNVRSQRDLLARLEKKGRQSDAALARELLGKFEGSLAILIEERDRIVRELLDFDREHPETVDDE